MSNLNHAAPSLNEKEHCRMSGTSENKMPKKKKKVND